MNDAEQGAWPQTSFLGRLLPGTREQVLGLGRAIRLQDGDEVLVEGTSSDRVLLLTSGWFKIVAAMTTGRESLLAIRVGGDLVGELGGVDGEPRIATVRASGPGSARRIAARVYLDLLARCPDAAAAANRIVVDRLRAATRRRVEFTALPTITRVARIITDLAAAHGRPVPEGIMIGLDLSQVELAGLAGTTEPTVHRTLTTLRNERLIATGYRTVVVLDLGQLAQRASL